MHAESLQPCFKSSGQPAPDFRLTRPSRSGNRAPRSFWSFLDATRRTCTAFALDRFLERDLPFPLEKGEALPCQTKLGVDFPVCVGL